MSSPLDDRGRTTGFMGTRRKVARTVLKAVEELNELRQEEAQLDTSGDILFTGPDAHSS